MMYEELDGASVDVLCDGKPLDCRQIPDDVDLGERETISESMGLGKNYVGLTEARGKSGIDRDRSFNYHDYSLQ